MLLDAGVRVEECQQILWIQTRNPCLRSCKYACAAAAAAVQRDDKGEQQQVA